MQCWRLDDGYQTLVLASKDQRIPSVIYWGSKLPDHEDLGVFAKATKIDFTGGMLDALPELSICPEAARSFQGQPGLRVSDATGAPLKPAFELVRVTPWSMDNVTGLTIVCRDETLHLTYTADISIDRSTRVISLCAGLKSPSPLRLHWLAAPVLPAPQYCEEMIDFSGRWCGEFQLQRTPWSRGTRQRENRTGRTGHEGFPALILPSPGATNTQGEAHALHYGWSGGSCMIAEELPDGRRQVQFGNATETELKPGTEFHTATLYGSFSSQGLNGCAIAFQRHLRDRIVTWPEASRPRPVHYNCWEAVYFDHDQEVLKDIATRAAELGAERFVLDDGWFGRRNDDTTSLGDWWVDPRKYPNGLGPLIDHIQQKGMQFGLWFEPEMVSMDSDLYRTHPDWILGAADQIAGRQQMVLNMALTEVRDHLFLRISALLSAHPISYVKWDHNRVLPHPDAAQARGTYALIDRLRAAFPQVEIESCASGGGRIDFGILGRTQRVWLSDSNDALERMQQQHTAALFLPSSVTGSHVGPRRCHTSGRVLDIELRAWIAAQRHMGFEMDPRELTEHEASVLRDVTTWWKGNRHWMVQADIHRLDASDPAIIAELQMARDGGRFVVFAGRAETSTQISPRPLRLTDLDPTATYRLHLRNRTEAGHLSRGNQPLKTEDVALSGAALMGQGIALPWSFPGTIWVVEGQRLPSGD